MTLSNNIKYDILNELNSLNKNISHKFEQQVTFSNINSIDLLISDNLHRLLINNIYYKIKYSIYL